MHIVRLHIERFRAIRDSIQFPPRKNALLGPNNVGKTAILEALNLLLTPHASSRTSLVDENDFFGRVYLPLADGTQPTIRVEAVIAGLTDEDADLFDGVLVPWRAAAQEVVERADEGEDAFQNAEQAIRPTFEAWYDPAEDAFEWLAYHRTDPLVARDQLPRFSRDQKRHIGFLIYRDFRALHRPVTLETSALFERLLRSKSAGAPLFNDEPFRDAVAAFGDELAPLADTSSSLRFDGCESDQERAAQASATARGSAPRACGDRVEEEATRVWLLHASTLLHGTSIDGDVCEAFDLLGISVVSADGNGEVPELCETLARAGVQTFGFIDATRAAIPIDATKFPAARIVYHPAQGLEDLLLASLGRDVLTAAMTTAPFVKEHSDPAALVALDDADFTTKAREFLRHNKGSIPFHEWLAEQTTRNLLPKPLAAVVRLAVRGRGRKRDPNHDREGAVTFTPTKEQLSIIDSGASAVVVAGPGRGKTATAIAAADTWATRYPAKRVLFTSFSNTAVKRISEAAGMGSHRSSLAFRTFHSTAYEILVDYGRYVGLRQPPLRSTSLRSTSSPSRRRGRMMRRRTPQRGAHMR